MVQFESIFALGLSVKILPPWNISFSQKGAQKALENPVSGPNSLWELRLFDVSGWRKKSGARQLCSLIPEQFSAVVSQLSSQQKRVPWGVGFSPQSNKLYIESDREVADVVSAPIEHSWSDWTGSYIVLPVQPHFRTPCPCSLISCVHWRRYDVMCRSLHFSMVFTIE